LVFYKKAIYTILEGERQARGGGVLPVAVIKILTPLTDPKNVSRETFIALMTDRSKDILQATGETPANLQKLTAHMFPGAKAAAAAAPAAVGPAAAAPAAGAPAAGAPPPGHPNAKRASDGNWYEPDPARPGQYLRVDP
jgi:hypothetical protein